MRQKSVSIEPKKAVSHLHIPAANQTFMMNPITGLSKKSVASGIKLKSDRNIVLQEGVPLEQSQSNLSLNQYMKMKR